jgi:hypothetical protein
MWSGTAFNIPSGWLLCNGQNNTPDLRDKFIIGAGNLYAPTAVGGSKDAVVVSHTHGYSGTTGNTDLSHTHKYGSSANWGGGDRNAYDASNANSFTTSGASIDMNHSHSYSGTTAAPAGASDGINQNLPPYYALAFIIKT